LYKKKEGKDPYSLLMATQGEKTGGKKKKGGGKDLLYKTRKGKMWWFISTG